MKRETRLLKALIAGAFASTLAACGTSVPVSVSGLETAAGDTVPGARGYELQDQDKIDEHVARMCAAGVYRRTLCDRHTKASAERRRELARQPKELTS